MSQTLVISETLYAQLESTARDQGLDSVEKLIPQPIQVWQARAGELRHRQETIRRIDALRERLFSKYGGMVDSADFIRADRER